MIYKKVELKSALAVPKRDLLFFSDNSRFAAIVILILGLIVSYRLSAALIVQVEPNVYVHDTFSDVTLFIFGIALVFFSIDLTKKIIFLFKNKELGKTQFVNITYDNIEYGFVKGRKVSYPTILLQSIKIKRGIIYIDFGFEILKLNKNAFTNEEIGTIIGLVKKGNKITVAP